MQVSQFDGGLNTKVAAQLVASNQGVVFKNIDTEKLVLTAAKDKTDLDIAIAKYLYYYINNAEFVSSDVNRDYVEYRGILYYTEDNITAKKYNGTVTYNLGVVAPVTAPTTIGGAAGVLNGTYQYVYTYYNSSDGAESNPSPLSTELTVVNTKVELSNIVISADPQVDKIRIYRVGGNITAFQLVDTINNGITVFSDNIADINIEGTVLDSVDKSVPPINLQFLTEVNSMAFGADGKRLHFTPVDNFDAWPNDFWIDFPTDVTGIGETANGVLIHTINRTWIITGTNPTSLAKTSLDGGQGCNNHKSISRSQEGVLWTSNDGICVSVGGKVQVITKGVLGKINYDVVNSCLFDEIYYIHLTDGTTVAYDFRTQQIFKEYDLDIQAIYAFNDVLYGYKDAKLYELFSSNTDLSIHYRTGKLVEDAYTIRKTYKNVYIRTENTITVNVYIDDILILTKDLTTSGTHEIKFPQEEQQGYSLELEFIGAGTVHEYEYKVMRRSNR